MAINYPRKQTVFTFLGCVLAVGGLYFYTSRQYSAPTTDSSSLAVKTNAHNLAPAGEISGPLASNWQKQFLSDDSGGKSASIKLQAAAKQTASANDAPLTLTDKLGQVFFTNYIQLQKGNLIDNDEVVASSANNTIQEALDSAKTVKSFTEKDIVISNSSDSASIHAYGNNLGKIILVDGPHDNAVEIAGNALDTANMNLLSNIDPVIAAYKKMISELRTTPVPNALVSTHLDILNNFNKIEQMTESLRHVDTDPMGAVVAMNDRTITENAMTLAIQSLKDYFNQNGVTFANNEYGTVFTAAVLTLQ